MSLKCKIGIGENNLPVAYDSTGKVAGLFKEALMGEKTLQAHNQAIETWAIASTEEFQETTGKNEDNATLADLTAFVQIKKESAKKYALTPSTRLEVINIMQSYGFTSLWALSNQLEKIFRADGKSKVNYNEAIKSGLYTADTLDATDIPQAIEMLDSLKYEINQGGEMTVEPTESFDFFREDMAFKSLNISKRQTIQDIDREIKETVQDFDNADEIRNAVGRLDNEEFIRKFNEDEAFAQEFIAKFRGLRRVEVMSVENGEMIPNSQRRTLLQNTFPDNPDLTKTRAKLDYISNIPDIVWETSKKEITSFLFRIESDLAEQGIDVIGLKDMNKGDVIEVLQAVIEADQTKSTEGLSTVLESKLGAGIDTRIQRFEENLKNTTLVHINSTLSNEDLFNQFGLIPIGENTYQRISLEEPIEEVYEYLLQEESIQIPEAFQTGDRRNDMTTWLKTKDTGHGYKNERASTYMLVFGHTPIEQKKVAHLNNFDTEQQDYLQSEFILDFYKVILKEKLNGNTTYTDIFTINDRGISLQDDITDLRGIPMLEQLTEYAKISKNIEMNIFLEQTSERPDEVLEAINTRIPEFTGERSTVGDYIITTKSSKKAIRSGETLYVKVKDSDEASIYGRAQYKEDVHFFTTQYQVADNMEVVNKILGVGAKAMKTNETGEQKQIKSGLLSSFVQHLKKVTRRIQTSAPLQNQILTTTGETTTETTPTEILTGILERLGMTNLASKVFLMNNAEIEAKLIELGERATLQNQIIGEIGAENLPLVKANLAVAREMETAGKDAKTIFLATGWERSNDNNKWKYNVNPIEITGDITPFTDSWTGDGYITLLENLIDSSLFEIYPQLKGKVTVVRGLSPSGNETAMASMSKTKAGYDIFLSDRIFNVGASYGKSVLIHEIQHVIQDTEGFAKGGSMQNTLGYEETLNKENKEQKNFLANKISELIKLISEDKESLQTLNKNKEKELINWITKNIRNNEDLLKSHEFILSQYKDGFLTESDKYEGYKRLAGEVEARNVQARANMTAEERSQKMLTETEDVAEESKIYLNNNVGEQQSATQEYFTREADRLPLTLAVFSRPEFVKLQGTDVNPLTILNSLNQTGIKQIEKEIIKSIIEANYSGQKKINYDELEATVRANIVPLERIFTSSYADYGMDNLGDGKYGTANTIILNAPIEHGITGHFSQAFKASGRKNIKYVSKQLNDNTWIAVEENYQTQGANDNNIYQFVGTAGTKEAVDSWITEYKQSERTLGEIAQEYGYTIEDDLSGEAYFLNSDGEYVDMDDLPITLQNEFSKASEGDKSNDSPINKGMFAHIRVWQDGDIFYVAEAQSDVFQKYNTRKNILESKKGYKEIESDRENALVDLKLEQTNTFIKLKALNYRFITGRKEAKTKTEVYIPKNEFNLPMGSTEGVTVVEKGDAYVILSGGKEATGMQYGSKEVAEKSLEKYRNEERFEISTLIPLTKEDFSEELQKDFLFLTEGYYNKVSTIEKEYSKKVETIISSLTKEEKQFIASQKEWEKRLLREALKEASLSGATSFRLPTPHTLSVIEGYVTAEGGERKVPYSVVSASNPDLLTEGDTINYLNQDKLVFATTPTAIKIVDKDNDITDQIIEDIRSDVDANDYTEKNKLSENKLVYKGVMLANSKTLFTESAEIPDGMDREDAPSLFKEETQEQYFNKYKKNIEEYLGETFTEKEWADFIEDSDGTIMQNRRHTTLEDATKIFNGDVPSVEYTPTFEEIQKNAGDYADNVVFIKERVIDTSGAETLQQPLAYKESGKDVFQISALSETQQTVAKKYEELKRLLEIERGEENVETVTDENGFDWYETKIAADEVNNPVVAFQKGGAATPTTAGFVNPLTREVFLNTDNPNILETSLHEYGHLYLNYIKENNPELYAAGLAKVRKGSAFTYKDVIVFDYLVPTTELQKIKEFSRETPLRGDEYYNTLKEDIRKNGIREPISVITTNGKMIIGEGNHRLRAAIELGIEEIPVNRSGYKMSAEQSKTASNSINLEMYGFNNKQLKDRVNVIDNREVNKTGNEAASYIAYVKKTQPDLVEGTEAFQNEVLAQVIGDMGAKLVNSTKQGSLAQWLADLWMEIKNMLGLSQYTIAQAQAMTLKQYADAINVDILSGKKIADLFNPALQELAKINPAFEGIQITTTPQEATPQTRAETPFGIERDKRRKVFKKAFGEKAADAILSKLSAAMQNEPELLIEFLKQTVPVKATMADVINANGGYLQKMFEKSIGQTEEEAKKSTLRPEDLLNKVGYRLDVKDDLQDAQKTYKGYYKDGEVICSLNVGSNRFNDSYVTFFVRDDAKETPHAKDLTQENITERWAAYLEQKGRKNADGTFDLKGLTPNSLDPYSTSVMSVQISKSAKTLKSISRYNHTLSSPDYTYKNLDNIVDELHDSFYNFFNVVQPTGAKSDISDGYILNGGGQLFKTNGERNGVNFGEGFYIKSDGETVILDPITQIMGDAFLFDTKNGTAIDVTNSEELGIEEGNTPVKITFTKTGTVRIVGEFETEIEIKDGNLYKLKSNVKIIGNRFLFYNRTLSELSLPNNMAIGNNFLFSNRALSELSLPNNTAIGDFFLYNNKDLSELSLPNNMAIGNGFLFSNEILSKLSLPNNTEIGNSFLFYNEVLSELSLPNNTKIGKGFLYRNEILSKLSLPNNTEIGKDFLLYNRITEESSRQGEKLTDQEFKTLYEKEVEHGNEITRRQQPAPPKTRTEISDKTGQIETLQFLETLQFQQIPPTNPIEAQFLSDSNFEMLLDTEDNLAEKYDECNII